MFDLEDAKKRGAVTLDGRKVRIICTDKKSKTYTLVGLVENWDGDEDAEAFTADGRYSLTAREHPCDLQNLPLEREVWVAEDDTGCFTRSASEECVREWCDNSRRIKGIAAGYAKVTIPLTK